MSEKYYIGIDNGINGGIAVLDENFKIIGKHCMPVIGKTAKVYDIKTIHDILSKYVGKKCFLFIEKSQPQYRDGSKQAWKTGYGYAVILTVTTCLQLSYEIVAPKVWQKEVFKGLNQKNTKEASILFCKQLFPSEDWTATERSNKDHDGLTDATCLAYYGRIKYG